MQIEHIEQWVGREVVDSDGESIGKLEQVYFRGADAVLAEVKPGRLARKRLLVPLQGATVTRDFVRVDFKQENLLQEEDGGAGFDEAELTRVTDHYGAGHAYEASELESSASRQERQAAEAEVRRRADELERLAVQREQEADDAGARADSAKADADAARETARSVREQADQARGASGGGEGGGAQPHQGEAERSSSND